MEISNPSTWLRVAEVARLLSVSERTVQRRIADGEIRVHRLGRRTLLIDPTQFADWTDLVKPSPAVSPHPPGSRSSARLQPTNREASQ